MVWTPPKTWNVAEVLTSADMNLYVRDNFDSFGSLTPFTPSWSVAGGTAPTLGNGTLVGRYILMDDWVWMQIILAAGSTTNGGSGTYQFALPFEASILNGGSDQFLYGTLNDLGNSRYMCMANVLAGITQAFQVVGMGPWPSGGGNQPWTSTAPFTFGDGDTFNISGFYRRN